jgi:hypothetical protein
LARLTTVSTLDFGATRVLSIWVIDAWFTCAFRIPAYLPDRGRFTPPVDMRIRAYQNGIDLQ